MAKKKAASVVNASPKKPRICFERIIPDSLDSERMVRRALRREMIESDGGTLDPEAVQHRTRMALSSMDRRPVTTAFQWVCDSV